MSIVQLAMWAVLACAVLGIAYVVVKQSGVPIPEWVWKILGIVIVAVVAILAIRFLVGFAGV